MKVPVSWLSELVDLPSGISTQELDDAFVRLGFEVEEILTPPVTTGPLVVGRVLEIEELTGFKKPIRYCQVEVGEEAPRGIVCGARNFAVGDLVVAALPGAVAAAKGKVVCSDGVLQPQAWRHWPMCAPA